MTDVRLDQEDKESLLNFLDDYAQKISSKDIEEIENKLYQKIHFLKKKKNNPHFVKTMISQLRELEAIWKSGKEMPEEKRARLIAGLHYFIWSEDRIPDYVPVLGYLDDAYVISVVFHEVRKYL